MKYNQGFSLIEVLVTIVLTTVGILGMVALQSKSIQYTQDAVNRNAVITLSNDLIETMRSYRDDLFVNKPPLAYSYTELLTATDVYSADGALTSKAADCPESTLAQTLKERAGCWFKQLEETLPGSDEDDVKSAFKVCPSYEIDPDTNEPVCAGANYTGSMLAVQLAWRVKAGECMDNTTGTVCTYTVRVEL